MTIEEMKEAVSRYERAVELRDAVTSLQSALRPGTESAVRAMLVHALGTDVVDRIPKHAVERITSQVWTAVCDLIGDADDTVERIRKEFQK